MEEQEFVPEVDAASLQHAVPSAEPPDHTVSETEVTAIRNDTPETLPAHIQELIEQAEAEGYLRGRNEAIEAMQHFDTSPEDAALDASFTTPLIRYNRRSIWD